MIITGTPVNMSEGIASDNHFIWIANSAGGASSTGYVLKVNIETSAATIIDDPSFNSPYGIASTGTDVFVTNKGNNTLSKINIATSQVTVISGASFQSPNSATWDGSHLWVGNDSGGVVELDGTGAVIHTYSDSLLSVYNYGFNGQLSSDGTNLWVASYAGTNTDSSGCKGGCVVKIDIASQTVVGSFTRSSILGFRPDTVFSNGTTVYIADDNQDTNLWSLDIATGAITMNPTNGIINDFYSATSDGSSLYMGQSYCGSSPIRCIPVADMAGSSLVALNNTPLHDISSGFLAGEVTWSRGCLWWAGADGTVSDGLLRICDSIAPIPTPTTAPATTTSNGSTTTDPNGLAATGGSLGTLGAASFVLLLGGGLSLMVARRRARTSKVARITE